MRIAEFGPFNCFVLAAVVLLSSCGGTHNDAGAGGASTPTTYLFFTGGASAALGAVDPGNATPAGLMTVEPSTAAISNVNPVYGGSYDATMLEVNGVHHRAVIYFKSVGGSLQLFKANALAGAAPAPVRVSSASFLNSGTTLLCSVTVYSDFADPDNSRVVYTQAGVDGSCAGTDNPLTMATLSMSSATAPLLHATPGARVIREIRSSSGAIAGWIMLLGTNLRWYQADMAAATSQSLAASVTSVNYLASAAGKEFLAVNTGAGPQVRIFDGTAALKNPGNTATALPASFDCKADDTYLFCADTTAAGRTIRRLPLDGGATWTPIYTGFSETMTGIVLSDNRVLFRDTSSTGQLLLSGVPKLPFDPSSVFPALVCMFSTTSAGDERILASGTRVYCSETSDSPARVKHIREDGQDEVLITDTAGATLYWTWQGGSTRAINEWQKAERLILGGQTGSGVNRLTSYDGPGGLALADLTSTLWTGFTFAAPLGDANKGNTLIILSDSSTGNGELFFADNTTANSLVRLTTTAANSETFVGASGCTLGSGQAPDPLLPALVVLAALYIWRRRPQVGAMTRFAPAWPGSIRVLNDWQFGFALLLGPAFLLVLAVLQDGTPAGARRLLDDTPALILLALVFPVLEEIVFRGAVQGFLGRRWVARRGSPLSRANLLTSILFAATHIAWLGDPAAGAVFFPSLVFGYFRERHATLASPILLHVFYNAGLFLIFGVPPGRS